MNNTFYKQSQGICFIMSLLKAAPLRWQIIRCLSDVVESNKTAKFVVHKGKFIKAPIDSSHPAGSEVTHTGQVFLFNFIVASINICLLSNYLKIRFFKSIN